MQRLQNTAKELGLNELEKLSFELAEKLERSKKKQILLFEGEMGAGKTTFIRKLGGALGVEEKITSPTFVGLHEYKLEDSDFLHIDLYQNRLDYEYLEEILNRDSKQIICMEWSEKLDPKFEEQILSNPDCTICRIKIEIRDENTRSLSIE